MALEWATGIMAAAIGFENVSRKEVMSIVL
jgi:hypothetical protein